MILFAQNRGPKAELQRKKKQTNPPPQKQNKTKQNKKKKTKTKQNKTKKKKKNTHPQHTHPPTQENLNYSPALNVVCQMLPQTHPQLQSYGCLLTRGI